jgi:hypothetical protein
LGGEENEFSRDETSKESEDYGDYVRPLSTMALDDELPTTFFPDTGVLGICPDPSNEPVLK